MGGLLSERLKKKDAKQKESVLAAEEQEQEQSPHYLNVNALKNVFGEALGEDVGEIEEFTQEDEVSLEEDDAAPPLKKSRRLLRRSFYNTVGIIFIVFAVIGVVSTINYAINFAHDIADNTALKQEFAAFIYPVVVIDPPAFDASVQLPDSTMISASIWNIILNWDKSKYASEYGVMTVPELDVEASATELFGKGLTFNHQTVGDIELSFAYDVGTKSYSVPSSPKYLPYSPEVESFTRIGESYILKVGYMPPGHAFGNLASDYQLVPDKYMKYTVTRRDDKMTVVSVEQYDDSIDAYS